MNGVPPAQVGPGPDNTPKPQDVLLLIRQGVANQDKAAVKTALQYATQMGTPIEAPILDMLRQWLGEDTFSSVMAKSPPTPTVVPAKAGAPVSAPEPVVKAKAAVAVPAQPPLVVIREGVAKQDKGLVRAALRMAVEQGTQIDKPVLDMLRKWLSEEDESLNILAARAGMPIPEAKASQEALAVSTVKAAAPAPVLVAARPPAPTAAAATAAAPLPPGIVQPREAAPVVTEAAPALREQTPKATPAEKRPPPQPVIQRGPMLKSATASAAAPPPPDLDASFESFLQELNVENVPAPEESEQTKSDPQPATKRRKAEEDESTSAPPPPEEDQPPPPAEPAKKPPPMRSPPEKPKKPSGPTKDEWGREVVEETTSDEKEAWQYIQEAQAAAKASVWGAGNFIDFNNFK